MIGWLGVLWTMSLVGAWNETIGAQDRKKVGGFFDGIRVGKRTAGLNGEMGQVLKLFVTL